MKVSEIKEILEREQEILFLKKKSESSFLDVFFTNNLILDVLLFFRKTKYDFLVISKKRIVLIHKNKLVKDFIYDFNLGIKFNALIPEIIVFDEKKTKISFSFMRLTYEEIKLIKNKIKKFEK
tara:strand:+ start:36424 stop:36792 length:369 start_codon:yes stop_codon:yes gene_type:complete